MSESNGQWRESLVEIAVVGLPFSAFKVITGITLGAMPAIGPVAYGLVALGAIDLGINLVNMISLLFGKRRATDVCVTDMIAHRFDRGGAPGELGIAIDVFVSFALVALVVGAGLFSAMPSWAKPIWNIAVVLNVLGAGVGRLFGALRQRLPRE